MDPFTGVFRDLIDGRITRHDFEKRIEDVTRMLERAESRKRRFEWIESVPYFSRFARRIYAADIEDCTALRRRLKQILNEYDVQFKMNLDLVRQAQRREFGAVSPQRTLDAARSVAQVEATITTTELLEEATPKGLMGRLRWLFLGK